MKERVITFGKVFLEIDKMAGLRIALNQRKNAGLVLPLQNWEQREAPEVKGALTNEDNNVVWEGIIMTSQRVNQIFQPLEADGITPITYARRCGKLGRPKTVGVIRLETKDAINFNLVLCDGGEAHLEKLASVIQPSQLTLSVGTDEGNLKKMLFDIELYNKKIQKLLNA